MKKGECCSCRGWIYWHEPLVDYRGKQYCIICFEDIKNDLEKE